MTVTAIPGPDETMSQAYVSLDNECIKLVSAHQDPTGAVSACKKVADEADQFPPQSHFVTRRAAFVYYTSALIQAKDYKSAVAVGDKAIEVVMLGHDDASGSSAAYRASDFRREARFEDIVRKDRGKVDA